MVKVPVVNLTEPSLTTMLREVDTSFIEVLKKEILETRICAPNPILCTIRNIKNISDFDVSRVQDYKYETLGGNHRRVAYQELVAEEKIPSTYTIPAQLVVGKISCQTNK